MPYELLLEAKNYEKHLHHPHLQDSDDNISLDSIEKANLINRMED